MKLEFACCADKNPIVNSKNVSELIKDFGGHGFLGCNVWKLIVDFIKGWIR